MRSGASLSRAGLLALLLLALASVVVVLSFLLDDPGKVQLPGADRSAARPATGPANSSPGAPESLPAATRATLPTTRNASAEPELRRPPTLLAGIVVREDGTPVEGAEVLLLEREADGFWPVDLEYTRRQTERARTRTGTDGRYAFPVPRARAMRLRVRAEGFAPHEELDRFGGQEVRIVLRPGATLSVAAVDATTRTPVRDVLVRGVRQMSATTSLLVCEGTTDARGVFRAADVAPGPIQLLIATPAARIQYRRVALEAGRSVHEEVLLDGTGGVHGQVTDATTGAPIARAEVGDSAAFTRSVRSDDQGRYALPGSVPPGHAEVHVRAQGYATAIRVLDGAPEAAVDVALTPAGGVRGRIVDPSGARPQHAYAAAAAVLQLRMHVVHGEWLPATIADDGSFVITGLAPDRDYCIHARAPGLGSRTYRLPRRTGAGEVFPAGDVVLRPAAIVEGRIEDQDGGALADIEIELRGTNADLAAWAPSALAEASPALTHVVQTRRRASDAEGRFAFGDLAAGRYSLWAVPAGGTPRCGLEIDLRDGEVREGVRIVLEQGRPIAGVVVDQHGVPVPRGHVHAAGEQGASAYAAIGADGRFRLAGLPDATYRIDVLNLPDALVAACVRDVKSGTSDLRVVALEAAWIEGKVVDAKDQPRPGLWVSAVDPADRGAIVRGETTGEGGSFRLKVLPGGSYTVHAVDRGMPMMRGELKDVPAGARGLVLRFR